MAFLALQRENSVYKTGLESSRESREAEQCHKSESILVGGQISWNLAQIYVKAFPCSSCDMRLSSS